MSPKNEPVPQDADNQYEQIIQLWTLRILVKLKGYRNIGKTLCFRDDEILTSVGLGKLADTDLKTDELRKALRQRLREVQTKKSTLDAGVLPYNLKRLKRSLRLTATDCKILGFLVLLKSNGLLVDVTEYLGELNQPRLERALATILSLPVRAVSESLATDSALNASGVLDCRRSMNRELNEKMILLKGFQDVMLDHHSNLMDLFKPYFVKSAAPQLGLRDYPHIKPDYELLKNYLSKAIQCEQHGVNVLIYGPPGTGKTELVRALANHLKTQLYEVASSDRNKEAKSAEDRFAAYQLSQNLLARHRRSAILFDEIEDVFPDHGFSLFGITARDEHRKAWINQLLENNPVPSFWLSNKVEHIDPAFVRRFDYVLLLDTPPRSVRKKILHGYLSPVTVSSAWVDKMAESASIAPGHVQRAAKIVGQLNNDDPQANEQAVERIIGNSLAATGMTTPLLKTGLNGVDYDPNYLNPSEDLAGLVAGVQASGMARMCLYGPPGTGKTSFGIYLAQMLDRPLLQQRASDVLGRYVGDTEKNIAGMFHKAEQEGAVLLLDEADSLLRTREGAYRSWEVSQVNELLVQMESYNGCFIAATNALDSLDTASLRRFDFKIKFDYLQPEQTMHFFSRALEEMGTLRPTELDSIRAPLSELKLLTPGDFAVILRQFRILHRPLTAQQLLARLVDEVEIKPENAKRSIGFLAN